MVCWIVFFSDLLSGGEVSIGLVNCTFTPFGKLGRNVGNFQVILVMGDKNVEGFC